MQLLLAHITTTILRMAYLVLGLQRRRHKVVVFSRQSDAPSRDLSMLVAELRRRDPHLELVVRCRMVRDGVLGSAAYLGEMLIQTHHIATASVCVVDGYIAPVSVLKHPKGLTIIQMWHALGAIKRFGLQSVGKPGGRPEGLAKAMHLHQNYDLVLCGGPASVPAFSQAFGVDERQVACTGLPRVDAVRAMAAGRWQGDTSAIDALVTRYPELLGPDRTKVLYAPTFRRTGPTDFGPVIEAFAGSDLTLIIKPHDLEHTDAPASHVVDARGVDVLSLIAVADVVITDYSAVAFEAAAVGRPLYFYVYDVERYEHELGLNVDPRVVMPHVTHVDIAAIVDRIRTVPYPTSELTAFAEQYVTVPPEGCTAAIADLVLGADRGSDR